MQNSTANSAAADASFAVNGDRMREVMGNYPTGVVIVTGTQEDGEKISLVIGSFSSVSLDPPLVSYMPMKTSRTFEKLRALETFAVNILAHDQEDVCRMFATNDPERWEKVGWRPSPSGAPILDGVVGWIDCGYHEIVEAGDHWIVLGAVHSLAAERDSLPLLFFQRGYGKFSPASLVMQPGSMIEAVRIAEAAREEIEALSHKYRAECTVLAAMGNEAVQVAVANASHSGPQAQLGMRLPFLPPLGTVFVDEPGGPSEEEWLRQMGPVDESVTEDMRARLNRARERGWSIALLGDRELDGLEKLLGHYDDENRTLNKGREIAANLAKSAEFHECETIEESATYDVLTLAAPVRDADGNVVIALRLTLLPTGATGAQVLQWKDELIAACKRVEARLQSAA